MIKLMIINFLALVMSGVIWKFLLIDSILNSQVLGVIFYSILLIISSSICLFSLFTMIKITIKK